MRARKTNLRPTEIDSNEHTQSYRTHITVGISTQINMKIEQYLNYHLIFLRSQKWICSQLRFRLKFLIVILL